MKTADNFHGFCVQLRRSCSACTAGTPCTGCGSGILSFFNWVTYLGYELFGVGSFVRIDVIDIKHRAVEAASGGDDPFKDGCVDLPHLFITALAGAAYNGNFGQGAKTDMFGVGITAFNGFSCFNFNVFLFIFAAKKSYSAKTGVGGNNVQRCGFFAEHGPDHALVLIMGNDRGGALRHSARGKSLLWDYISFFLPFSICFLQYRLA